VGEPVVLCRRGDLASGEARRFDVGSDRIALVRIGDDFYAIGDRCSHEDYSLAEGEVWEDERELECPRHGSTFDLRTGEPCSLPATKPVPVYRVELTDDEVAVVVEVAGREVVRGVDLTVRSGEVHVVMGPNGSGKSTLAHALMGRPGTVVTQGSITIDGVELVGLPAWERARAGLFLALQQPIEVPGVRLEAALAEALTGRGDEVDPGPGLGDRLRAEASAIGFDERFLNRPLNVDLSGGERKRNEVLQLGVLRPPFCVLDEIDSGLDVDALGAVARRIEAATTEWGLGVLAVTHFHRLLVELRADVIHVLVDGRLAVSGGPELAEELEKTGYASYGVG
jgi:Fe-S cluster assembly ATP-binding protein